MALEPSELTRLVGDIDIYLFDQVLRGRLTPGCACWMPGAARGETLVYLLHAGFEVFASDASAEAIASVQDLAAARAPHLPLENFRVEPVERAWRGPTHARPPS